MRVRITHRRALAAASFVGFVGTVFASNWLIGHFGMVPVGFGLIAPAAVYAAGFAFGLRDAVHSLLGTRAAFAAVALGAALSWALSAAQPRIALASAGAFLVSEVLDLAVYSPLRKRRPFLAVLASNTVGLFVDSAIFLSVAFGSLALFWGQAVGKGWVTLVCLAVLFVIRWVRSGR